MSTNENPTTDVHNVSSTEDSLDDFAAELFGDKDAAPDNAKSEDVSNDDDVDADAPTTNDPDDQEEDDTQSDDTDDGEVSEDDDTLATDEDEDADEDDGDQPKPKKKNRFQERIDELTAARKEAERNAEQERIKFEQRLAELESKLAGNKDKDESESNESESTPTGGPDKNAVGKDGKPKYPLGEYDPQYMRDMVEHMLNQREQEQQQKTQQTEQERQAQAAKAELQTEWNTKLVDARERYPDFQQKGEQMLAVFEGIDQQYGEYLTDTIMEMDSGPDVFYYLSSNVDEAQKIVAAGPKKATIALAKLEAKLADGGRQGKKTVKATNAKNPPPQNKGSAVSKPAVDPDTDDLAAFERQLFRKK